MVFFCFTLFGCKNYGTIGDLDVFKLIQEERDFQLKKKEIENNIIVKAVKEKLQPIDDKMETITGNVKSINDFIKGLESVLNNIKSGLTQLNNNLMIVEELKQSVEGLNSTLKDPARQQWKEVLNQLNSLFGDNCRSLVIQKFFDNLVKLTGNQLNNISNILTTLGSLNPSQVNNIQGLAKDLVISMKQLSGLENQITLFNTNVAIVQNINSKLDEVKGKMDNFPNELDNKLKKVESDAVEKMQQTFQDATSKVIAVNSVLERTLNTSNQDNMKIQQDYASIKFNIEHTNGNLDKIHKQNKDILNSVENVQNKLLELSQAVKLKSEGKRH